MLELGLMLLVLHAAAILVIIRDWLKYKYLPYVVDGLFLLVGGCSYIAVCYVVTSTLGFTSIEKSLTAVACYVLAHMIIPRTPR